ncbi:type II toxin-antitoxin system RelE/ParE family toxin [Hoeflea sp.]|uniref:type II toxin-antitoxin system RelE/ParE family toxin n=1 Tax=Hoeflea sp. TaxID=1940281 RepID=UPI003B024F29
MWKYRCYITNDEPNLWSAWYSDQSEAVRAKHDTAFEFLEARIEWDMPRYRKLQNHRGLGEVRLHGNVQWRIFGFCHTEQNDRQFVVLAIGNHKQQRYSPQDVLKTAAKRMNEVRNDPEKAERCERPEGA